MIPILLLHYSRCYQRCNYFYTTTTANITTTTTTTMAITVTVAITMTTNTTPTSKSTASNNCPDHDYDYYHYCCYYCDDHHYYKYLSVNVYVVISSAAATWCCRHAIAHFHPTWHARLLSAETLQFLEKFAGNPNGRQRLAWLPAKTVSACLLVPLVLGCLTPRARPGMRALGGQSLGRVEIRI